jgi:hypothetical protein
MLALALGMVGFIWASMLAPGAEGLGNRLGSAREVVLNAIYSWTMLSVPMVGGILAVRRASNPIGWLLLVAGVSLILTAFIPVYVQRSLATGELPGYQLLDWLTPIFLILGFVLLVLWLPFLFPDGRLPGPGWRALAWVAGTLTFIGIGSTLFYDAPEFGRSLPSPVVLEARVEDLLRLANDVLHAALILFIALAFVSVVVRVRASRGVIRQQMKWFLAAVIVLVGATAVAMTGSDEGIIGFLIGLNFLPIAIGIAILRYRLYDIDRLISRTIGWALVTGIVVAVFVAIVLGLQALLSGFTQGETLAVAASTLAAFALFQPLRRRIQVAVDRQFDRAQYDGQRTVDAFAERLRGEVELETVTHDLRATAVGSVNPSRAGLWLRRSAS